MSTCFRNAVFTLCKKLSNNNVALNVRSTIHDMSVVITTDEDDPKVWKRPPHGDLAQIAAHHRLQFMGYLLADESVEDIIRRSHFRRRISMRMKERYLKLHIKRFYYSFPNVYGILKINTLKHIC